MRLIYLIVLGIASLFISACFNANKVYPEYSFSKDDIRFKDASGTIIKGCPDVISIDDVPPGIDSVKVFWPPLGVQEAIARFTSTAQPGDLFGVGEKTEVVYKIVLPDGKKEEVSFFIEIRRG